MERERRQTCADKDVLGKVMAARGIDAAPFASSRDLAICSDGPVGRRDDCQIGGGPPVRRSVAARRKHSGLPALPGPAADPRRRGSAFRRVNAGLRNSLTSERPGGESAGLAPPARVPQGIGFLGNGARTAGIRGRFPALPRALAGVDAAG